MRTESNMERRQGVFRNMPVVFRHCLDIVNSQPFHEDSTRGSVDKANILIQLE